MNHRVNWVISKLIVTMASLSFLAGCSPPKSPPPPPQLSPLELQSIQTKTYPVVKQRLFYATVATLEAMGFQIQPGSILSSGTIVAESANLMADSRYRNITISVFISELADLNSRIRINLQRYGQPVMDPQLYQEIFSGLAHNLFTEGIFNL